MDLEYTLQQEVTHAMSDVTELFTENFKDISYPEHLLCAIILDCYQYCHDGETPQDYTPQNFPHAAILELVQTLCRAFLTNKKWERDEFQVI